MRNVQGSESLYRGERVSDMFNQIMQTSDAERQVLIQQQGGTCAPPLARALAPECAWLEPRDGGAERVETGARGGNRRAWTGRDWACMREGRR